jgi:flagellin
MNAGPQNRNVEIVEECIRFARNNILVLAGTAMLAQANAIPQSVLRVYF